MQQHFFCVPYGISTEALAWHIAQKHTNLMNSRTPSITHFVEHWTYRSVGYQCITIRIIFRSKFFFLFIGREPTTWPANNCLQIMVCSCAMPSNCVWLQVIFCTCVKETVLFSFLRSLLRQNGRSLRFSRIFINKTNSVIELSVSRRPIICRSRRLRQIIDLLATDKSRYFAQPRAIIVNY